MAKNNTLRGLFGVFGIWLTAGIALPWVNAPPLDQFSAEQLMVFRGFITALIVLIWLLARKENLRGDSKFTYAIMVVLPLATLGLFNGIQAWGPGPTIIVVTATPVVNLGISLFTKRKISHVAVVGLGAMITGVGIAHWGGEFQWEGFLWSIEATVANGILYECFSKAKEVSSLKKCFYACIGMGTLGLLLSWSDSWSAANEITNLLYLVGFAFVSGFLYWFANFEAFNHLDEVTASVLAQGETPFVILGAWLLVGDTLSPLQWIGVGVALTGAGVLARWRARQV